MGSKLSWVGLGLIQVSPIFGLGKVFMVAGAIIMTIGVILICLDK